MALALIELAAADKELVHKLNCVRSVGFDYGRMGCINRQFRPFDPQALHATLLQLVADGVLNASEIAGHEPASMHADARGL
jgi:hypothetical protein